MEKQGALSAAAGIKQNLLCIAVDFGRLQVYNGTVQFYISANPPKDGDAKLKGLKQNGSQLQFLRFQDTMTLRWVMGSFFEVISVWWRQCVLQHAAFCLVKQKRRERISRNICDLYQ